MKIELTTILKRIGKSSFLFLYIVYYTQYLNIVYYTNSILYKSYRWYIIRNYTRGILYEIRSENFYKNYLTNI